MLFRLLNMGCCKSNTGRIPVTICISVICNNGSSIIYASDSMITNRALSIEFEHPTKKTTEFSEKCIALTAGDALAHTELFGEVQARISKLSDPSVHEIVENVKKCYQQVRKKKIEERILIPRGFANFQEFYQAQRDLVSDIVMGIQHNIEKYDYGLEILISGISNNKAHIFGVDDPGTSQCFDAIGFHAIGSGLPHALNTLIARGVHQEIDLNEGLLIVYEAKKMAEKAPGVGSNRTDIGILDERGIFELSPEMLDRLQIAWSNWLVRDEKWKNETKSLLKEMGVQ